MINSALSAVNAAAFASTIFVLLLHGAEWFNISKRLGSKPGGTSVKLDILKLGLGIEMGYYFLLLVVFVVLFSGSIVFLTLIAILGLLHLVAFQGFVVGRGEKWLQSLTSRAVAGVLIFDFLEIVVLVFLASQFYLRLSCYFVCFS